MRELTRIREDKGLSRAALANKAGVKPSTVIRIEAGERSPTVETLEKLASALEIEVADFFPKGKAALWSSISPEWRPDYDFEDARRNIEQFCEYWRGRIHEPTLNYQTFRDASTALEGWLPTFEIALDAELYELNTRRAHEVEWETIFTQPHASSELMKAFDAALIPLAEELARLEGEYFGEKSDSEVLGMRDSIKERSRRMAS